jgi:hydrogenase nickel incorporation protein HypB
MCTDCGCDGETTAAIIDLSDPHGHDHAHPHGHHHAHPHGHAQSRDDVHAHNHDHAHAHDHDHPPPHPATALVEMKARVLAKNDALAQRNRAWFAGREILALNLVSAPGAGKTSLLARTIVELRSELPLFVIEGDQATTNDAERIRAAGAPVIQVNTGTGCHLDAEMVARGLARLRPDPGAAVLIENVGNLVCPALFDLGEQSKVVIFSVTEGEDKPIKYPHMFRAASLVIINKIDLLPHLDFNLASASANLKRVNPRATMLRLSARTGQGMGDWYDWLRRQLAIAREGAFA